MISRTTEFKVRPDKVGEIEARLPAIKEQLGAVQTMVSNIVMWNGDGTGMTVAVYHTLEDADAALAQVGSVWQGVADLLAGPPEMTTYANAMDLRG